MLAAAACSGDDGDGAASAAATSTTAAADEVDSSAESSSASTTTATVETVEPEAECPPTKIAVEAGTTSGSLTHDGVERTYQLSIPPGYGSEPAPLLLNFHGFGGTGAAQNATSGLVEPAGELGYVVVAPDGGPLNIVEGTEAAEQAEAEGFGGIAFWNIFGTGEVSFGDDAGIGAEASEVGYDDIDFVGVLIDSLESELCIDTARVYATGHSNGAGMSSALGCEIGSRFAAIAPVSGVNLTGACPGDGPVPVLAIHGDADEAASYEGNYLLGFELGNPSVPDRMTQWAELNGCDPEPSTDESTAGVVRAVWSGCEAETELWTITGGMHAWPHGDADEPPTAVDAGEAVLAFFERNASS